MRVTNSYLYNVDVSIRNDTYRWSCELVTYPNGRALAAILENQIDKGFPVTSEVQDLRDVLAFVEAILTPDVKTASLEVKVAGAIVGIVKVQCRPVYTVKERRGREPRFVVNAGETS